MSEALQQIIEFFSGFVLKNVLQITRYLPVGIIISIILQKIVVMKLMTGSVGMVLKHVLNFSYWKIVETKIVNFVVLAGYVYLKYKQLSFGTASAEFAFNKCVGWLMMILAYAGSTFVCFYVYDCCMNLAQKYIRIQKIRGHYNLQIFVYSLTIILSLASLHHFINSGYAKQTQFYLYIGIVLCVLLIVVLNAIYNKHIICSALLCLCIVSTAILRILFRMNQYTAGLPVYLTLMIMMAFDAEHKQSKDDHNYQKGTIAFDLLKLSVWLILYVQLGQDSSNMDNIAKKTHILKFNGNVYFQLCLAAVAILATTFRR